MNWHIMKYIPYFTLGVLVLGFCFYLIKQTVLAPRKRHSIISSTPVSGNIINDTTCILLSEGSSLFTDGNIVIKAERINPNAT
jgi:hypothetical protein